MSRFEPIRDQRGTTMVELLVATAAGVFVLFAITAMVIISLRETARVNTHVDATQRARTVLNKVIEELHSACIAPLIAPVREESTGTKLIFLHQTGSEVAPTPVKSEVTLNGTTVSQSNYPSTGGEAPNWTFSSTPSSTEQLMTNISPTPPNTSIFNYYSYSNGEVSATPLSVPLEKNAANTVEVGISLTAAPQSRPIEDPNAAANVSDSALLRFSPAPFNTSAPNLPCQ